MDLKHKRKFHTFYLVFIHVATIVIFLFGFLPLENKSTEFASFENSLPNELNGLTLNLKEHYTPKFKRLVFVLIDALRADFIFGEKVQSMPFISELQFGGMACSYLAHAHSPTVTLPRIKALVTGTIPGFADVIFNLGSTKIGEDNIIEQFARLGHHIVFYGDDTWLKLFPEKFLRSEGTTSFFVNDFYEVDNNVTRHLDFELKQTDWDVMILHYLGLDHIGHVHGPKHPKVMMKLNEMDSVLRKLYQNVFSEDTLIVVCGDHGMSDAGSHGGSSKAEVEIPLIFIMKNCKPDSKLNLQIDLAPTLAVLMGTPIPRNSLGSLLPGILTSFELKNKLYASFVNAKNVARQTVNTDEYSDYELALKLYQDWLINNSSGQEEYIIELFLKATAKMKNSSVEKLAKFDVHLMVVAIVLSLQLLIFSCLDSQCLQRYSSKRPKSYVPVFVFAFVCAVLHSVACLSFENDSCLCLRGHVPFMYSFGLGLFIFKLLIANFWFIFDRFEVCLQKPRNVPELFLLLGSIAHAFSLSASSFVEEEHQTYYYFFNTLALLLFVSESKQRKFSVLPFITFMAMFRITRFWNQTGDKWINEADVKEWLNRSENKYYLTFAAVTGAVGIFRWILKEMNLTLLQITFTAIGLFAGLAHRCALGVYVFYYPNSTGTFEAAVVYFSLIAITALSRSPNSIVASWVILTCLLKRSHNLFLTCMHLLQYSLISSRMRTQLSPFYCSIAHYWMGMVWFFQEGNGNNLARIDLASGYVGLPSFNIYAVGFLLSCATFSGPVLALLLAVKNSKDSIHMYGFIYPRMLIITIFLVIVTMLRYHLFVWTVFSPKLLYEGAQSLFLLSTLLVVQLVQ